MNWIVLYAPLIFEKNECIRQQRKLSLSSNNLVQFSPNGQHAIAILFDSKVYQNMSRSTATLADLCQKNPNASNMSLNPFKQTNHTHHKSSKHQFVFIIPDLNMECYFNKRRLITSRCGRHFLERNDVAAWNKDGDYCLYGPGSSLPGNWSNFCDCSHYMKDIEAGYDHKWLRGEIFKPHPYGHWCPNRRSFTTHCGGGGDSVDSDNYLANHLVHVLFKPYDYTYYKLESEEPRYGLRPVNFTCGYENGMQQNIFHYPMVDRISEWKKDLPVVRSKSIH